MIEIVYDRVRLRLTARGSSVELGSGHAEIVCAASPRWRACAKMICDQICAGFDILRQMYPERVRYEVRG